MRVAILSDIHSNSVALKACFHHIEENNVNHIIFLGDFITDYPCTRETLDLLKKITKSYACTFIRGNREDYMIAYFNGGKKWTRSSKNGALLYSAKQLHQEDIAFFKSLSIYKVMEFKGCEPFMVMHGSYESNTHLLLPEKTMLKEIHRILDNCKYDLVIGGHCHKQFCYRYGNKKLINSGSVGIQNDGTITAKMLFLDWEKGAWKETLLAIDYDVDVMMKKIIDSSYFEEAKWWSVACTKNLYTGNNETLCLLSKANELAIENNDIISELYFEKAAKELGLLEWKKQCRL